MQVNGLIAGLNIVVQEDSGAKLKMRPGQKFEGVVTEVVDNQHAVIDIDGQKVLAETRFPLAQGQQIHLQVKEQQQGQVVLQVLPGTPSPDHGSNSGRLEQLLNMAGVPIQEENLNLVHSLIKHNVSPTPQVLRQAVNLLQTVGNTPSRGEIVARILGQNITLEPELVLISELLEAPTSTSKSAINLISDLKLSFSGNSTNTLNPANISNPANTLESSPSTLDKVSNAVSGSTTSANTNLATNQISDQNIKPSVEFTNNQGISVNPNSASQQTRILSNTTIDVDNVAANTDPGSIASNSTSNSANSAINSVINNAMNNAINSATSNIRNNVTGNITDNPSNGVTNTVVTDGGIRDAIRNAASEVGSNSPLQYSQNTVNQGATQLSVALEQISTSLTKLVEALPGLLQVNQVEDSLSQVQQALRQASEVIRQYQTGEIDEHQVKAALNTLDQSLPPVSQWLSLDSDKLAQQLQAQAAKWFTKGLLQVLQEVIPGRHILSLNDISKVLVNGEEYLQQSPLEFFEKGVISSFRESVHKLAQPMTGLEGPQNLNEQSGLRHTGETNDLGVQNRMEQVISSFQRHMEGLREVQSHPAFREPQSFISFPLPVLVNQQVHTGMLYAWKNPKKGQRQNGDSFYILLALNTPALGELKVHLEARAHRLELQFGVSNNKVARVFEQNKNRMMSSLEQAGFEIKKCGCYVQMNIPESADRLPMEEVLSSKAGVDIKV